MTSHTDEPEHLLVAHDVFAGDRFWAALDRLADRRGHDGHPRILVGVADQQLQERGPIRWSD